MRTTSLIVTLFGDVVSQHGNTLWLGSLVRAMAPMGINERLVRTSVFRLVKEGWLESERVGRRSFYRFTHYGTHEYEHAARRIYALENNKWRGRWQLLIPQDIPEDRRERFKRSLHWLGYRAIAAGTYAKPGGGGQTLKETLEDFNVADKVIILDAQTAAISSTQLVRKLVHDNWQLEVVAQGYRDFLKRYKPLLKWAQRKQTPEAAFVARTLLIHDYRRILLNDTPLPDELLPSAWPGAKALQLTGVVYKALAHSSIDYIYAELESGNGTMPEVDAQFWNRFGRIS
jgi:phenylacetic acid degradation operon negative regulatory protein